MACSQSRPLAKAAATIKAIGKARSVIGVSPEGARLVGCLCNYRSRRAPVPAGAVPLGAAGGPAFNTAMRIVPVLDLLGGVVVRGVGGRRREYRPVVSRLTPSCDPLDVARAFADH